LENGEIFVIDSKVPTDHTSWEFDLKFGTPIIPGEILSATNDPI
jgi:hypothetical protein